MWAGWNKLSFLAEPIFKLGSLNMFSMESTFHYQHGKYAPIYCLFFTVDNHTAIVS